MWCASLMNKANRSIKCNRVKMIAITLHIQGHGALYTIEWKSHLWSFTTLPVFLSLFSSSPKKVACFARATSRALTSLPLLKCLGANRKWRTSTTVSAYSERLSASVTQGQCRKQSKKLSVYKSKKRRYFYGRKQNGFHVELLRVVLTDEKWCWIL